MRDSAPAILLVLLAAATGCGESTGPTKAIQPTITAGRAHSCLLSRTGAASCWGDNAWGELGDGSKTSSSLPVLVSGGLHFTQLIAGDSHACALTSSGAAYCWGSNSNGELGSGDTLTRLVPVSVSGGATFSAVAAGFYHTCGIATSGAAYCWGMNGAGQLGNGASPLPSHVPVPVSGGLTFTAIAAGDSHSCGIIPTGAPYCWGSNSHGESGNLTSGSSVPQAVIGFRTLTSINAGGSHTCGLTSSGAAHCWGYNGEGGLGDGTVTDRIGPVAVSGGLVLRTIATGSNHTCGLTSSDAAYCWGSNHFGELGRPLERGLTPAVVTGLTGIASLNSASRTSTLAP